MKYFKLNCKIKFIKMNSDKDKLNSDPIVNKFKKNFRPDSEWENMYEEEKEQKFDNIPLIKPPINYKKIVKWFNKQGVHAHAKWSSSSSSVHSSRRSSQELSDESMSMWKTMSQDPNDDTSKNKFTIVNTILEHEGVKLIKRIKGQRESFKWKLKSQVAASKNDRKNSIRTLLDDSAPSFSFNFNMLYPKNVMTYSAYIKNMEGFVKNTLNLKKDVKLMNIEKETPNVNESVKNANFKDRKTIKVDDSICASNKQIAFGANKSNSFNKNMKSGSEANINEENHPSLKRRYARLFITMSK